MFAPQGAGVTRHTDLTDKEIDGVIDHTDVSVTSAKIADGAPGRLGGRVRGRDRIIFIMRGER